MSACWGSSGRKWKLRLAAWAATAAGIAMLAAGTAAAAKARATAPRDTSRTVGKILISDEGIRIDGRDAGDGRGDVEIHIDRNFKRHRTRFGHGLRESTDTAGGVTVVGPGIVIDTDQAGLVRVFADAEVPAGERVEGDVVAVFGSVTVRGQVAGDVVAVFGSVRLDPGAAIEGDVVAIGGVLDQAQGATVGGESVSLGFFPIAWGIPTLPVLLSAIFACWLLSLFVGWLTSLIFPERMLRVATTASRRTAASLFMGLVSLPLMIFAVMLLFITVIGIPIALLMPVFYVLMVWAGQLAATCVLGSKIVRRPLGGAGMMGPLVAGTLFVAMFFVVGAALAAPPGFVRTAALFFCLLGVLLIVALSTVGAGAVLLSRIGAHPADVRFEREPGVTQVQAMSAGATAPPASPGA